MNSFEEAFFKSSPDSSAHKATVRPAMHVTEAQTLSQCREIHRKIWNQGFHPFLIILLPDQVRVFSGFAFDPDDSKLGTILSKDLQEFLIEDVASELSAFSARTIDSGEIWQRNAEYLGTQDRVDTTLLTNLRDLGFALSRKHSLPRPISHALIGKFVYLAYLRARGILSDKWISDSAKVDPRTVFIGETFSSEMTLKGFRAVARAVERRFNGKLFPIPWGSRNAPKAEALKDVARTFAGDEIASGQRHLSFKAYDFGAIPVEFLSSVYEQFLHAEHSAEIDDAASRSRQAAHPEKGGAHYTPEFLADYLAAEMDSVNPLRPGTRYLHLEPSLAIAL
jgi:hypothetical protein